MRYEELLNKDYSRSRNIGSLKSLWLAGSRKLHFLKNDMNSSNDFRFWFTFAWLVATNITPEAPPWLLLPGVAVGLSPKAPRLRPRRHQEDSATNVKHYHKEGPHLSILFWDTYNLAPWCLLQHSDARCPPEYRTLGNLLNKLNCASNAPAQRGWLEYWISNLNSLDDKAKSSGFGRGWCGIDSGLAGISARQ